ncbi:uncharacterized protein ACIQIH_012889 isoform 3-T3 [Cyanocitta cristata]
MKYFLIPRHCGSRQHPRPVEELSRGRKYSQCRVAAGGSGMPRQFEERSVVVQLVGNFCAQTRRMLQLELIHEDGPATTSLGNLCQGLPTSAFFSKIPPTS